MAEITATPGTTPASPTDQAMQSVQSAQQTPPADNNMTAPAANPSAPATGSPNPQTPDNTAVGKATDQTKQSIAQVPPTNPLNQKIDAENQQAATLPPSLQGPNPALPASTVPPSVPNAVHPMVQQAGVHNSVALALAGGPRYQTTIDPNTGISTKTQVPMSRWQVGMAIAMEALSGGVAGLQAHGPNHLAQAAGNGLQEGKQLTQEKQQADQQQAQQASQDYARQAAITQANFQTHANMLKLGTMEHDYQQKYVDQGKPILDEANQVGAIQASNVNESDLLSKYHVTKDMAIPDGVIPRMTTDADGKQIQATNKDGSEAWDTTYSVIDPKAKITLPPETLQFLADHHVQGYYKTDENGKAIPANIPADAKLGIHYVVGANAAAQNVKLTEDSINNQLKGLTSNADDDAGQFEVNLKKGLADGSLSGDAMKKLSQYSSLPLNQITDAMAKDKVDPKIIGQVRTILPADAIKQMNAKDAQDKTDAATKAAVEKQKALAPGEVKLAGSKGYATGREHEQGTIDAKRANGIPLASEGGNGQDDAALISPALAPYLQDPKNYDTPTGTNDKFLQALQQSDPGRAAVVKAYADGMDLQSYYAAAKRFGGTINAYIHAYDPSFNANEMQAYSKTIQDARPSGPIGKANRSASTTFKHLDNLNKDIGFGSTTGMSGDYKATLPQATIEMSNAYANGNKPGENEIASNREGLGSHIPWIAKGAIQASARNLYEKVSSDWKSVDQQLPKGVQRPGFIDDDGANAYHNITGNKVDIRYIIHPNGATGTAPDTKTGTLYWHDAQGKVLGAVPGQ